MTTSPRISRWTTAWLFVGILLASCSPIAAPSASQPSTCDGIPADMGGCSDARPVFGGTTCSGIGTEWGTAVNAGVLSIINGPATVDGQQRSTRISDALVLPSIVAGMRLDELDLLESCDVPEFLAAAQPEFSAELIDGLGPTLFDGAPPATQADWDRLVSRAIGIIDDGESP